METHLLDFVHGQSSIEERKEKKQTISDLFGTPFKVGGIIQSCVSECSKQLFSFDVTLRWKNKTVKYVVTNCYVKDILHVEQ